MSTRTLIFLLFSFFIESQVVAQQPIDSATKNSIAIDEVRLIKDHQQKQIDSLVKIQLE